MGRDLQSVIPGIKRTNPRAEGEAGRNGEREPKYEGVQLKELVEREEQIGDREAYESLFPPGKRPF